MSTQTESSTPKERSTLYVAVSVVFLFLLIISPFIYVQAKDNQEARDKADQLIAALDEAGARAPSQDQVVNALGTDGGAVCADPNNDLARAALLAQMVNGAGGPGTRPVIVDRRVVAGQLLIMEIYCPDELTEFQDWVTDLKFDDVASD